MTMTRLARSTGMAVATLAALASLVACGDDPDDAPDPDDGDAPAAVDGAAVSEACVAAYPMAFGEVHLEDVEMLPDDWPEPPVDATLCVTSGTVGDAMETADYITDADEDEVLAAYLDALSAYGAAEDEDGLGDPVVTGQVGSDVLFQVQSEPGRFSLVFQRQ
jgi:hypothetical protein